MFLHDNMILISSALLIYDEIILLVSLSILFIDDGCCVELTIFIFEPGLVLNPQSLLKIRIFYDELSDIGLKNLFLLLNATSTF